MRTWAVAIVVLVSALTGCLTGGTDGLNAQQAAPALPTVQPPPLPEVVQGVEHILQVPDIATGAGMFIHGHHAYVTGRPDGFYVLDLSADPKSPQMVAHVTSSPELQDELYARDAYVTTVGDRTVAAFAGQGQGVHLFDVTDPAMPAWIATFDDELQGPSHNLAFHPTLPILYNSESTSEGGTIDIIDVSDPATPTVAGSFGDLGCHDITFHVTAAMQRLYCAGVARTQIWDIADPFEGRLISEITLDPTPLRGGGPSPANPDPMQSLGLGLHHSVYAAHDGKLLIIGDEFMGGGGPGCHAHTTEASTPFGAVWFVDVNDEVNWELLGWFSPAAPLSAPQVPPRADPTNPLGTVFANLPNCTSHFGEIVPGQDQLIFGWYRAGVLLVDFSDPASPQLLDQWNDGTNTWEVRLYGGVAITGDIARGSDVLELV